ncbi:hypothetical protein H0R92_09530 [Treponema sp. OMZ 840]|uniref:hypothetical protein n=1 Tax=Treponema sp. OMZ 840 TaxID=244313 RepID=UPI003D8F4C32
MCWKCGKTLDFPSPVSRSAVCPECGSDVRCCRNCDFYEKGAHYDCRETIDEPVRDKERSCFCGWFSLNPNVAPHPACAGSAYSVQAKAEHAKNAFNALFGD